MNIIAEYHVVRTTTPFILIVSLDTELCNPKFKFQPISYLWRFVPFLRTLLIVLQNGLNSSKFLPLAKSENSEISFLDFFNS